MIELFRRIVPELGTTVWLRDGRRVLVRPLGREDAPRLVELHRRLSPRTRYLRFMSAKPVLGIDEAEHLAHVDFRERFAVAAVRRDGDHEEVVAVAVAVARFHLLRTGRRRQPSWSIRAWDWGPGSSDTCCRWLGGPA